MPAFMINKKNIILIIVASVLLSAILLSILLNNTDLIKTARSNKEDNCDILSASLKKDETVVDAVIDDTMAYAITSKTGRLDFGDTLVIFKQQKDSWERIYENDFMKLRPWKIELADIDGDNIKELVTAVRKTTHFDKTTKNRLFVFNYTEGKLIKKWTGSQIAGVWENYAVGDFAPTKGSEVAFIRRTNAGERVSVYYWYDFGFLLLMESKDYENITDISITEANRIIVTYKKGKNERTAILKALDGKLVEVAG